MRTGVDPRLPVLPSIEIAIDIPHCIKLTLEVRHIGDLGTKIQIVSSRWAI